ncbi:MAG: hypothetical protein FIB04_03885 [Gammaproteobacteria bacterium]|nr:hypothetical protein [Gammaproteobacteria bacterium]
MKARLIGATVLVALAVLLIPELLSGRKPADLDAKPVEGARGTRTFTIELGGPAQGTTVTPPGPPAAGQSVPQTPAPGAASVPAVAPEPTVAHADGGSAGQAASERGPAASVQAPESKPAPEASAPPPKTVESPPAPVAKAPAPAAAGATASPAAAIPARGGWAVQVGAFGTAEAANKLVKSLQAAGYKAYVSPVSRAGKALYRVRVGPVAERAAAAGMVDGLKAKGLPATVVAND